MKIAEKIKVFLKEVYIETKKIDWPSRRTTLNYTILVLGISLAVALILGFFDFIFVTILQKLIL